MEFLGLSMSHSTILNSLCFVSVVGFWVVLHSYRQCPSNNKHHRKITVLVCCWVSLLVVCPSSVSPPSCLPYQISWSSFSKRSGWSLEVSFAFPPLMIQFRILAGQTDPRSVFRTQGHLHPGWDSYTIPWQNLPLHTTRAVMSRVTSTGTPMKGPKIRIGGSRSSLPVRAQSWK